MNPGINMKKIISGLPLFRKKACGSIIQGKG
jgi:hypothetical protein